MIHRRPGYNLDPSTGRPSSIILPSSPANAIVPTMPNAGRTIHGFGVTPGGPKPSMRLDALIPSLIQMGCQPCLESGVVDTNGGTPAIGVNAKCGPVTIPFVFDLETAEKFASGLFRSIELARDAAPAVNIENDDLLAEAAANVKKAST